MNPLKLNYFSEKLLEECTEANTEKIEQIAKNYISILSSEIDSLSAWQKFNQYLNSNASQNYNEDFVKHIFISIYSIILQHFQSIIPGAESIQLNSIANISSIFDTENIVTEKVWGAKINNDVLVQGPPVDTKGIITEFKSLEDTVYLVKRKTFLDSDNQQNADTVETIPNNVEQPEQEPKERTSPHTITAAFNVVSSVNEFGQLFMKGSNCPVCGKHVDFMPSNGYCSLKCAGLALLQKVKESLSGEYVSIDENIQKKIDLVKNILDYVNLCLNLFNKIPDVLAGIIKLPEEYKRYATQKINIIFLEIKQIINLLLIKKNEIIIRLLKKIKFGTIDNKVSQILPGINAIIQLANQLKQALTEALNAAYMAITKASGFFYIGPQEYGFFMTLKSYFAICPYFKTDINTYPPEQLGRPYWGPMVFNIAFDMSKCQFSLEPGIKSALQNRDFKKINSIIKKIFLPIQEVEYLMDPDLFDVRLALSDQNATTIQKLIEKISSFIVLGGDFIPAYKNLKLTNIWYIVAILTCWGPWTKSIYGDYIFHGPL